MTDYLSKLNTVLPQRFVYDRYYFNGDTLEKKKLNIVQCFFRKLLGWYEETHILPIAKKAYELTLIPSHAGSHESKQKLFNLIAKANEKYGELAYFQLPQTLTTQDEPVHISLSCDLRNIRKGEVDWRLRNIDFNLIVGTETHTFSLFKSFVRNVCVLLPKPLFEGQAKETADSIRSRLSQNEQVAIITGLLIKVLKDSDRLPAVYFSGRHFIEHHESNLTSLNTAQNQGMASLGWECPQSSNSHPPLYVLRKREGGLEIDQKLNLSIAVDTLV